MGWDKVMGIDDFGLGGIGIGGWKEFRITNVIRTCQLVGLSLNAVCR